MKRIALLASAAAEKHAPAPCIAFHPDLRGFDSRLPNAERVAAATSERLTGEVAHLVVHVESRDRSGPSAFEPAPREMFVYPTGSGRYVVRFSDPWPRPDRPGGH